MAEHLGYTTHTRNIPIEFFLGMIEGDIKKLIHTHGHKNCGLSYEDVCKQIQTIITTKKTLISRPMDDYGRNKLDREWRSKKNGFLKKLFEDEGFINMCVPKKYKNNPSINQLLSRHIKFCKEKDAKREAVEKNFNFNACREYDSWIETQRKSFHQEYLKNVRDFGASTVNKYFSTKEHTQGHDPVKTYLKSKLDCNQYNPSLKSHTKKQLEKEPTNELQPSMEPKNIPGSQGKDGSTPKDKDSINATTKTEENIFPKPKPRTLDSQISSRSKTQTGGTSTVQDTPVKTEDPGSPVSKDDEKKGATMKSEPPINSLPSAQAEAHPQAKSPSLHPNDTSSTPAIQIVPVPTATTSPSSTLATAKDTTSSQTTPTSPSLTTNSASSLNSVSLSPSDPFSAASVNNDQGSTPHSTTPVTSANIHSTEALPPPLVPYSSLGESQSPALSTSSAVTVAVDPKTVATSITSTITTTVTTTSAAPGSVTILTVSAKTQPSISSTNQAPGIHRIPQPPTEAAPSGAEIIKPAINPPHTSLSSDTPSKDKDTEAKSATDALPKPKGPMQPLVVPLSKNTQQETGHASNTLAPITYSNLQSTTHHIDQQVSPTEVHHSPKIDAVSLASDRSGASVTSPNVNTKTATMDDSKVRTDKNDNPRIIPEEISSLTHIISTLLVILATITLLFQLYKYTPFGFLLGRRRKRKKQDLRRIFEKPEKPAYESPNITVHEWEDPNLVGQTVENDVYTKLLKINRYKQEIQKRKKKNKKTLIEVHMEVLEEYKTDDWELHKGDFLEICVRGFINEENETYQKFPNSKLTINNINEKTIEYIKKQDILWNNWIENHRNILEQWKKEEWFHILKNKWRNEEQKYKEKNDKLQENILNEQETHSIVSQKDIWKQWISKQATLIKMFNQEGWFKELVYAQDKEKDNYHINEYNNVTVTTETQLKNEKRNNEYSRSKDIIQKLMVQIHMMVLEECIKEDIIKQKELCIDNFIEDIHNNNNYDEKRNIPLCDTDNSKVPKCEEMHTSRNK